METPEQPLQFQNPAEWRAWLQENHAAQGKAWLMIRKGTAKSAPGVSYEEAVEEAVCYGWIDGLTKSLNAEYFVQRFTPRKKNSTWSVSNIQRVERLSAQGRMAEAGMARVKEAQENGAWEAALRREDVSTLPEDLLQALAGNPSAQANFAAYPASQKKMFLHWIMSAKTETTRQKRIREAVEMAAQGKRLG
jgi:uncharacterized protein YdeI (YjbR/CyaY-like superfamily)